MMKMAIEALEKAANTLASSEVLVETNDGTYGAVEACRKIGTGDPFFATYRIYEQVGSSQSRVTGCDPNEAPGRARRFRAEIIEKRAELARLRKQIATLHE